MLPWIFRRTSRSLTRRWGMALSVAVWIVEQGRERIEQNLTSRERDELLRLVKKSKGRPGNLSQKDRARIKSIAGKAIRG